MATLSFQDFVFKEKEDEIEATFLKIFNFNIKKSEIKADVRSKDNSLEFPKLSQDAAKRLFSKILLKGFSELKNKITKNPAVYIHKNSGIPLFGSLFFGIVDKGTDMLELKPITSCNIDCAFCSVDEGLSSKKQLDFVVEKDYLVEETRKLLEFKGQPVHIYINPHGEPLLYADIVELVSDLSKLKYVKAISIITNGSLLNDALAEKLIKAGLTELNISLNSLKADKAKQLAGTDSYDVARIISVIERIKGRIKIIITPVLLDGINNNDIEELVAFCKKNNFEILIQNFLCNKRGRKPVKEMSFDRFYSYLKSLEDKYSINLVKTGKIVKTKELAKPFRKGDVIEAKIFSQGRYADESLAIAKERIINVKDYFDKVKISKIRITADRHNLFYGEIKK